MGNWHTTGCVLCAQNCGLEILVEEGRMVKVRPDKDNPRSEGYACRKGLNVIYHQYPADRLTHPLKRVDGAFVPISWDQAMEEIAEKLKTGLAAHGPRSFAYLGASAQGGHMEAGFGVSLMRALGSQNLYTSAGQEFSGAWWVQGRMFGKQYILTGPDEHETQMLVAWGWNGMQSHQMPKTPMVLKEISKNPERLLVAVDPRKSETAEMADIHLALRPGTDALLIKAMIAILVQEGWEKKEYLEAHCEGWERIRFWFENFDSRAALEVCGLAHETVHELCRLMATRRWSFHPDLGIYMGRHSTLNSYLLNVLGSVCGIFGQRGGNIIPGMVMPLGFHADERSEKVWKSAVTGMPPAAAGSFPCSILPEEILSDHKDRIRSIIVSTCNPLRSWPDTKALERAFSSLDLMVVCDMVMSETARLAHYVLPCRSFYESYDGTFFPWTYPEVYFQLRRPLVKPHGESLEASQIFTLLADRLGLIPEIPEKVMEAASKDRMTFGAELMGWIANHPEHLSKMLFILGKTLGKAWDSAALAALWGMMMTAPKSFRKNAARAGFETGFDMGDRIFQALLDHPQGLWVGKVDREKNLDEVKTISGKINLFIEELAEKAASLTAAEEIKALTLPEDFPLVLNAGRHRSTNMNTQMRNPEWIKGKRGCTIAIHPEEAAKLGLQDKDTVRVVTEGGSAVGELEVKEDVRPGMVLIPHGFGLIYDGVKWGFNVNDLTMHTHRDPIGTPLHRLVPCRLELCGEGKGL
ncbi:molybdopterin-dependent oxidoreductase [Desulfobotulus sp. H1]|uniref:Molybdopterin-dependent oxidoreductase n=1 Tax=Desulfobotulus pelophilus TaxID=2823377 RepID=A0ABT3N6N1_9BACT|nr:molybdopterin-dependent oxidoreductase [Desulfobotulus pelophilus]MCW7753116.1 molybdopterin-dependent oxidoreductase [Desulfobotulus pelophilus]